jgi:hypothetical protein
MNDTLERIVADLETLALVKKGEKLITNGGNLRVDPGSFLSFITRWQNNEGREETAKYLASMVKSLDDQVNRLCEENKNRDNFDLVQKLLLSISKAVAGIEELIKTYQDTPSIASKLKTIVVFFLDPSYKKLARRVGEDTLLKFQGMRWPEGKAVESNSPPAISLPPPAVPDKGDSAPEAVTAITTLYEMQRQKKSYSDAVRS